MAHSIPFERISTQILIVRGQRVMLDAALAELYGVATKVLIQAVKRNLPRFPSDFMFQVTNQELAILKSQFVTSRLADPDRWGGRRKPSHAFTEHGVAMLSSVLRSKRAIAVNIAIMRAFVRLRAMVSSNVELAQNLAELERRVSGHDEAIRSIVHAIRELAVPPDPGDRRRIGFV